MSKQDKNVIVGIVIIAIGCLLLFDTFGFINIDFWRLAGKFWPLILIIIGLVILLDSGAKAKADEKRIESESGYGGEVVQESTAFGLLGDIKMSGLASVPDSIDKSLLIGDIVIDLSGAKIPEGECHISVSVLIGDIDIFLPANFPVKANLNCLLGSTTVDRRKSDGLAANLEHEDDQYAKASTRVYIHGRALIGDISVTRTT